MPRGVYNRAEKKAEREEAEKAPKISSGEIDDLFGDKSENSDSSDDVEALEAIPNPDGTPLPKKRGGPRAPRKPKGGRALISLDLAKVAGEGIIQSAARAPVYGADAVGTILTKGRFQLMDTVQPEQLAMCDEYFKQAIGAVVVEVTPLQAWLYTCGFTVAGAVALAGLQYAMVLKLKAGKISATSPGAMNGATGSERVGAVQQPEGLQGQPSGGQTPTA